MNTPGVFLRGMLMGAADIVPGVSGGTVAFITGIYDTLLDSIRAVDLEFLGKAVKAGYQGRLGAYQWRFSAGAVAGYRHQHFFPGAADFLGSGEPPGATVGFFLRPDPGLRPGSAAPG